MDECVQNVLKGGARWGLFLGFMVGLGSPIGNENETQPSSSIGCPVLRDQGYQGRLIRTEC